MAVSRRRQLRVLARSLLPAARSFQPASRCARCTHTCCCCCAAAAVLRSQESDHVKNEADILARLSYPFIVTLYHRFQDERNLYLTTEFVQHGTLNDCIHRNNQLPNDTARFFAAQCWPVTDGGSPRLAAKDARTMSRTLRSALRRSRRLTLAGARLQTCEHTDRRANKVSSQIDLMRFGRAWPVSQG